jgi:ABC-type transport system involved in multi-copper enzyme maturation permease subunit
LIKPHKRLDIIIAKMIACIVTIIISMLFIGIVQFFVGGIIFGFDSYSNQYIGYNINSQKIFSISLLTYFIINGILKIPEYLIISLFCILIGISNKNITMSMIITLIICLFCNTILVEWSKVDALASITRFFITNNWDFSIYLFGNISNINGINLWYSVIIYIIYFVLLLKMSIGKFKKLEN